MGDMGDRINGQVSALADAIDDLLESWDISQDEGGFKLTDVINTALVLEWAEDRVRKEAGDEDDIQFGDADFFETHGNYNEDGVPDFDLFYKGNIQGFTSLLRHLFQHTLSKSDEVARQRLQGLNERVQTDAVPEIDPDTVDVSHLDLPHVGRFLTNHKLNGLNEELTINVIDEPGHGNANHEYVINWPGAGAPVRISFQNGTRKEAGINGVTNEVLIAILIDRMEGFQSGDFACHDNQMALDALQTARLWLHKRTLARLSRGVEGTHVK